MFEDAFSLIFSLQSVLMLIGSLVAIGFCIKYWHQAPKAYGLACSGLVMMIIVQLLRFAASFLDSVGLLGDGESAQLVFLAFNQFLYMVALTLIVVSVFRSRSAQ